MTIRMKLTLMVAAVSALIIVTSGLTLLRSSSILNAIMNEDGMISTVDTTEHIKEKLDSIAYIAMSLGASIQFHIDEYGSEQEKIEELIARTYKNNPNANISKIYFGWAKSGKVTTHPIAQPPTSDVTDKQAEGAAASDKSAAQAVDSGTGAQPKQSSSTSTDMRSVNASNCVWFSRAISAQPGSFVFSTHEDSPGSSRLTVTASSAVYDSTSKLIGVIACDADIVRLAEHFTVHKFMGDRGDSVLMDSRGIVLSHKDIKKKSFRPDGINDPKFSESMKELIRRSISGESGIMDYSNFQNKPARAFYCPVGYGLYFCRTCPISNISNRIFEVAGILITASTTVIFIIIIICYLIVNDMVGSVKDMQSVTRRLGNGDLTARFNEGGSAELSCMAKMLNATMDYITNMVNAITSESHSVAEQAEALAAFSEETFASMTEINSSVHNAYRLIDKTHEASMGTKSTIKELTAVAVSERQIVLANKMALAAERIIESSEDVKISVDSILYASNDATLAAKMIAKEAQRTFDTSSKLKRIVRTFKVEENIS